MAFHIVFRDESIDQVQAIGRVGDRVAAGVTHLVFTGLFADAFSLVCESRLHIVPLCLVIGHQLETDHICRQIIAGMFHICTDTEMLTRLCVIEPVLSHDVVSFFLLCVEGGCKEFYFS